MSESDPVEIIGYAVGDFDGADTYEIVTAWTSPHYRGLNFALAVPTCRLIFRSRSYAFK